MQFDVVVKVKQINKALRISVRIHFNFLDNIYVCCKIVRVTNIVTEALPPSFNCSSIIMITQLMVIPKNRVELMNMP